MLLTRKTSLAIAIASLSHLPFIAHAQNQSDDVMVVTAAGFEQKLTDAPASVTVITSEELRTQPYTNLLDALRNVEGVDIGESQDKSGQSTISIRGMGSDYTLVLIDGKRQNNSGDLYPNNFVGFQMAHIPPLDMIERIEVVRGPMSTLYGADAMGGVVNIITKRANSEWGGSISHSRTLQENSALGDVTTTDFFSSGPLIEDKLYLSLRGSIYDKAESTPSYAATTAPDGSTFQPSTTFGGGGKTSDNQNWSAGFGLTFLVNENNELLLDYDASRQKYDNSESQFGTTDSADTIYKNARVGYAPTQRTLRDQISLTHIAKWDFGRTEVGLSHVVTENLGRSLPLSLQQRQELASKKASSSKNETIAWIESELLPRPQRELRSASTTLDAKLEMPFGDHFVVVGGQLIDSEMEDGVFGMLSSGYQAGAVQEHKQYSLFAEDSWQLTDELSLTGGARYDHHSTFGSHVSPRLYAVYALTTDWTLKGGVSTGYKTPKTSDLYAGITGFGGQGTSPWVGNPDLQPETSVNSEFAVYYSLPQGHTFNATLFYSEFKDKIESIHNCYENASNSACTNVDAASWNALNSGYKLSYKDNVGDAEVKGLELAGRYVMPYGLSLKANYTYTDSEIKSGVSKGKPLTSNPVKHMLNTTLNWQANQDFALYLVMEANSDRYQGQDSQGNDLFYKDFEIFHLGSTWDLSSDLTISARINNLFDKDFSTYDVEWTQNGDGSYIGSKQDHYNVIHQSRNFWISANMRF
ncbi:TonB-dependent receptor domain-containing protein [Vibrio qinghaiensis]|nr:TonB-dependent receptor [Vibrio qinghaiensis]